MPPIDRDNRDKQELERLVEDIQAKVFKYLDNKEAELHARDQSAQYTAKKSGFAANSMWIKQYADGIQLTIIAAVLLPRSKD